MFVAYLEWLFVALLLYVLVWVLGVRIVGLVCLVCGLVRFVTLVVVCFFVSFVLIVGLMIVYCLIVLFIKMFTFIVYVLTV